VKEDTRKNSAQSPKKNLYSKKSEKGKRRKKIITSKQRKKIQSILTGSNVSCKRTEKKKSTE
jgi:hypothetical protein